jgi:hypothetical protein
MFKKNKRNSNFLTFFNFKKKNYFICTVIFHQNLGRLFKENRNIVLGTAQWASFSKKLQKLITLDPVHILSQSQFRV